MSPDTEKALMLFELRVMNAPPDGAGPLSVTVTWAELPLASVEGLMLTPLTVGSVAAGFTVRVACCELLL